MANAKQKNNQSGCSMVEMLGVLAIIGVLTVGGIIGYSYATDKHAANKIVDGANKFAVLCSAARQQNNTASCAGILAEMGLNTPPDNWTFTSDDLNGEFDVTIPDVRQKVCQAVTTLPWPIVLEMKSGEVSVRMDGVGCADSAPLTLTFANDLSTGAGGEGEGGTPCNPACVHGTCSAGACVCDGLWTGAACDVCAGGAQGSTCCARLIDGVCCAWSGATEVIDGQCCQWGSCCPSGSAGYSYQSGRCCYADELVEQGWDGLVCCPSTSTGVSYDGQCCTSAHKVYTSHGAVFCCPSDSPGVGGWSCCESGEVIVSDTCCPAGSTGYGYGIDGYYRCCTSDEVFFADVASLGYGCCPENSIGFSSWQQRCCGAGETVINANLSWYDPSGHIAYRVNNVCCPGGSTGVNTDIIQAEYQSVYYGATTTSCY